MSQYTEAGVKAFVAGGALAQHLRVKLSTGKLAVAGAADGDHVALGTIVQEAFADGEVVPVRLRSAQGTFKAIAAGAIAVGAAVYSAADGKVNDVQAQGAFYVGNALEAASGDGSVIEVLRGYEAVAGQ